MISVLFRAVARTIRNSGNKLTSLRKIQNYRIVLLSAATVTLVNNTNGNNNNNNTKKCKKEKTPIPKDVRSACNKNDESLKELMHVLCECIKEISKEYQANLKKQIEIINDCTKVGPIGEHWDQLTHYRVVANELRQELTKYEILVQKVGQMAYNQAVTSLLSGIENAMDLLDVDFNHLEKTVTQLSRDNYQLETKLLYANRDSILHQK